MTHRIAPPTPADLAALTEKHRWVEPSEESAAICGWCGEMWSCPTVKVVTALDAYGTALRTIRDQYGQVCERYATCDHPACRSSSSAWVTADAALAGGVRREEPSDA